MLSYIVYNENGKPVSKWYENTLKDIIEVLGLKSDDILFMTDFKAHGKTYSEKQSYIEELAKEWQTIWQYVSFSYGEIAEFESFFSKYGKRYGLLETFRAEAIC